MKKVLVLGCGNILAGDDGIGVAVARKLARERLPENVEVLEAGAPGLSLVEMMLGAGKAVLVDAFLDGAAPGMVKRYSEAELPPVAYAAGQSHGVGLREALAWARLAMPGDFPAEVVVIGVEIARPARWHEGLTPPVELAVKAAVELVLAEVAGENQMTG